MLTTARSACDQVQMLQQVCLLSFTVLSVWNSLQTIYLLHNICIKVAFHTRCASTRFHVRQLAFQFSDCLDALLITFTICLSFWSDSKKRKKKNSCVVGHDYTYADMHEETGKK
ncbi:hypothetical protein HanPI659440_Chr06g0230281 [Helianthus annuus]|nr:hypothetical protein HanPI659440_Chr06g0230281 [Helianthus annuus]